LGELKMKKSLLLLVFILCLSMVSAETILLDDVEPGSLSAWYQYDSGVNPYPTFEEIVSPYDSSTAIRTSVYGNTLMNCDTKYITKVYDPSSTYNTDNTELEAYLEFAYDGTYYNFPYFAVFLLDNNDNQVGQHIWYGKGVVGGLYQSYIAADPTSYTELSSDKGYFTLDLSEVGTNVEYRKIKIGLYDYTCIGTNSIVFDELSLVHQGGSKPVDPVDEVPEFGVIAGGLALIGALGIFIIRRRH
jgi:hypothetical protein